MMTASRTDFEIYLNPKTMSLTESRLLYLYLRNSNWKITIAAESVIGVSDQNQIIKLYHRLLQRPRTSAPGTVVYEILDEYKGAGGQGEVWSSLGTFMLDHDQQYAQYKDETDSNTSKHKRIVKLNTRSLHSALSEFRNLARVPFFRVKPLIEAAQIDDTVHNYLVMREFSGICFNDVIQANFTLMAGRTSTILPRAFTAIECFKIMLEMAYFVLFIHHHGLIHRDIKPNNFVIDLTTSNKQTVLVDLGIAIDIDNVHACPAGSTGFVAPEITLGEFPTPSVDVYALGVCVYIFLCNTLDLIWAKSDMASVQSNFTPKQYHLLLPLLEQMTADNPEERPNMYDVIEAIENLIYVESSNYSDYLAAMAYRKELALMKKCSAKLEQLSTVDLNQLKDSYLAIIESAASADINIIKDILHVKAIRDCQTKGEITKKMSEIFDSYIATHQRFVATLHEDVIDSPGCRTQHSNLERLLVEWPNYTAYPDEIAEITRRMNKYLTHYEASVILSQPTLPTLDTLEEGQSLMIDEFFFEPNGSPLMNLSPHKDAAVESPQKSNGKRALESPKKKSPGKENDINIKNSPVKENKKRRLEQPHLCKRNLMPFFSQTPKGELETPTADSNHVQMNNTSP